MIDDEVVDDTSITADVTPITADSVTNCVENVDEIEETPSKIERIVRKRRKAANYETSENTSISTPSDNRSTKKTRRKKNAPKKYVDPSVKLNNISVNKKVNDDSNKQEFICGVCDENLEDANKASYHIYSAHNGLARLNSKEPFTSTEENEALRNCLRRIKKLTCPKSGCRKMLTTLMGFKLHVQSCGSVEKVTCRVCQAVMKPLSLLVHMRNSHGERKSSPTLNVDDNEPRESRKAAVRARKSVQQITTDINNDKSINSLCEVKLESLSVEDNEEDWFFSEMITDKIHTVEEDGDLMQSWMHQIKLGQTINCRVPGCSKSFKSTVGMKYHYQRCGRGVKFICKRCGHQNPKKFAMKKHIQLHFALDNGEVHQLAKQSPSIGRRQCYKNSPYVIFLNTFLDTFVLSHVNRRVILYDSWLPALDNWLPISDFENYIPREKSSVKYMSKMLHKFRKEKQEIPWRSLALFEADADVGDCTSTLFVGGSIEALAWCPTPPTMALKCSHDQYLAVSAQLQFQNINDIRIRHVESQPGLIQIWNFGPLSNSGITAVPKLSFGIGHDYGIVKCMEWCNTGCHNDSAQRLGLLAVGCTNANLYIYSIPKNEMVANEGGEEMLIMKPLPVAMLKPLGNDLMSCLCLAWFPSDNRSRIIAGFANGLVCIWDLTTKSQLLWQENDTMNVILPFVTFLAHEGPVLCVSWCPNTRGEHFCTGGADKEAKIWSITHLECPVQIMKKTIVTDCQWSPLANGVFTSHDDSYLYKQNRTYFFECGLNNPPRCLGYHNGSATKLSFSEWLNTLVSCDYGGEVIAAVCYHYQEHNKRKKNSQLYRLVPICQAIIQNLDEQDDITNIGDNIDEYLCTYDNIVQQKGVVFHDAPVSDFCHMDADDSSRVNSADNMNAQPFKHYNLQSVNTVSWNPNCGSHQWLASGFNCGLVRLHCISALDNPNLKQYTHSKLLEIINTSELLKREPDLMKNFLSVLNTTDSSE